MVTERQVSFASGELAPTLWGRTDLREYSTGLAKARNFIVGPHGQLTTRTGTQRVEGASTAARLFSFIYSETDNFVCVFKHELLSIYETGADSRHDWDLVDAIATPYDADHLSTLKFAQFGNKVTIVSPHYDPYELVRDGEDWSIGEINLDARAPVVNTINGLSAVVPLLARNRDLAIGGDADHLPREWSWAVSYVVRFASGLVFETYATVVANYYTPNSDPDITPQDSYEGGSPPSVTPIPALVHVSTDYPVSIWTAWYPKNAAHGGNDQSVYSAYEENAFLVETRVYRGRRGREADGTFAAGQWGFVGSTTGEFFEDIGAEPDFSDPPRGLIGNPFYTPSSIAAGSPETEPPEAVCYFEGRRYFARGSTVWGSKVDRFDHYEVVPATDDADDPVQFDLMSARAQTVRHLVPHQRLMVLTNSDEWVVTGSGQNDPISAADLIWARNLGSEKGSASLPPLQIGGSVVFLEQKGNKPRLLVVEGDQARAIDLSYLSRHLFDGFTIVGWAYAEDPFGAIFAARSDGALLSMTYSPERGIMGWTRHDIAGGLVKDVCTKPEGSEDGVYLIVDRGRPVTAGGANQLWLERLAYKILPGLAVDAVGDSATPDSRYDIRLDACVSWHGKDATASITAAGDLTLSEYSSGGWNMGATITVTFAASYSGNTGQLIQVDDPDGGEPIRIELTSEVNVTTYRAQITEAPASEDEDTENSVPDSFQDVAIEDWWVCKTFIATTHLPSGTEVAALADGAAVEDLTVAAGGVTLPRAAAIAHVGIPFDAEAESLDAAQDKAREKVVEEVVVELEHTRGGYVGESLDDTMRPIGDRNVDDAYSVDAPKRTDERVPVRASWSLKGRWAVRQSAPLSMTILGVTRVLKHGG